MTTLSIKKMMIIVSLIYAGNTPAVVGLGSEIYQNILAGSFVAGAACAAYSYNTDNPNRPKDAPIPTPLNSMKRYLAGFVLGTMPILNLAVTDIKPLDNKTEQMGFFAGITAEFLIIMIALGGATISAGAGLLEN